MAIEKNEQDARARAAKIKMILYDVDGVLTDGTIWVVPTGGHAAVTDADPANKGSDGGFGLRSQTMAEMKGFYAHDGIGVSLARIAGIPIGFITKRISEALRARARDLKIEYMYDGQAHKMKAVQEIADKTGFSLEEMAFVGDDIVDIPALRNVGFAVAVADAVIQVKQAAHWVTPSNGGRGAGRDVVDFILDAKGILDETIEKYIDNTSPEAEKADIGTGNM